MAMERKGKMVADERNCRLVTFTFYFKAYALCIMLRTISSCLKPPDSSHYDVPLPLISSSQVLAVMQEFVSSRMVKNGVCNRDNLILAMIEDIFVNSEKAISLPRRKHLSDLLKLS